MGIKSYISNNIDVYIYYVDMPCSISSNIVDNGDGSYTLYLNSRLSYEKNLEGYLHEMKHINNNDFNSFEDIQKIESRTHKR